MDAQEIHRAMMEDSDEESTMNTANDIIFGKAEERRSTALAAEVVTLIRGRNYGAAEAKAHALHSRLMQESQTTRQHTEQEDAFISAIVGRINNMDILGEEERGGLTSWMEGHRSGYKHTLSIYRNCKKNGVI